MKSIDRVFSIVPDCHVSRGYYRSLWDRHFYQGIRDVVGSLVTPTDVDFDWARGWSVVSDGEARLARERNCERLYRQIREAHKEQPLDCIISYCFARDVLPEMIRDVVRMGIPWINFFCDSTHMFGQLEEIVGVVTLNWFPESSAMEKYRGVGGRVFCRPYAMNPAYLPECGWGSGSLSGVGFVGFPSANRITQLGWFGMFGAEVEIRGRGWVGPAENPFHSDKPAGVRAVKAIFSRGLVEKLLRRGFWPMVRRRAGAELSDQEFFEFLGRKSVILGLNQGRDEKGRLGSYLKFRDLEFPGYGCCYLTEKNSDLVAALEPGREVLTFESAWEGASKCRFFSQRPDLARKIGEAGRKRVLAEHTWKRRLGELAAVL